MRRAALFALSTLLLAPAAAEASFPGRNGGFAVTVDGCQENRHIRLLTTAGRAVRDLTPPCDPVGEDEFRDTFAPDWSPDGSRLAYADASEDAPWFLTVAADGSDVRRAAPSRSGGARGGLQGPSFSPGGTRLAYEWGGRIHTAALDGSDERVVHDGRPFYTQPRWSPDGRTFVVERRGAQGGGLWLISASNGRTLRRLSRGGFEPDWSPDGRRLVFRSRYLQQEIKGGASGGNLFVVRADGRGGPRPILRRPRVADTSPVWSPDGRWIAWVSLGFSAGDVGFRVYPSLWRMPARGGRPRKLGTLPSPDVEEGFFSAPELSWQPLR